MPSGIQQPTKLQTPQSGFLGLDTASEPTGIDIARSRRLMNAYVPKLKALGKRPGSVPVIDTALSEPIRNLTIWPFGDPYILASSGDSLYKYESDALTPVTMTNNLASADIYAADFTAMDSGGIKNVKVIADGGLLKTFDGTEVKDIAPASDDPSPAPANVLTDINAKGIKYVWEYSGHVFVSPGTNEVFYSKRVGEGELCYSYFPETYFEILVRKGDYVNGPGIPFDNVMFIPMRNGWNVWQGDNFDNFDATEFLNTINGVIAPRSPRVVTYADGHQAIVYLSDDGCHEIYTTILDNRGKQYATRSLMANRIDFEAFGFTESEKSAAVSRYIVSLNMYLLEIDRDGTPYVFGYDTRIGEWFIWTGLQINSLIELEGVCYFAGNDGLLKKFDKSLHSDWSDKGMTEGVPVDFDRITGMLWFEDTGYASTLDYYILRLKEYAERASLDISIIHMRGTEEAQEAIRNNYLIWDVTEWDESTWANVDYTELVAAPQRLSHRLKLPKKGYYFQVRWRNNRNEPVEIYGETLIGRTSGEY